MKKILLTIVCFLLFVACGFRPVMAGMLKVALSELPGYEKTTDFKLYYVYMETEEKTATINLFIQKDGKDWRQTEEKNKTDVNGYFQIKGADIYDGEGKYHFYASAVTADQTVNSATVTTILDMTAPGTPSEYGKERLNSTTYKLSWKNPSDEDFEKVYIYRSKEKSFTADISTRIGEAGGSKEEKMTFNDGSVEADVEYFYALRVLDHAGNASGVVTDAPGIVTAGLVAGIQTSTGGVAGGSGEVSILPVEETPTAGEGELGGGVSTEEGEVQGETTKGTSRLPFIVGAFGLLLIAGAGYFYWKRNKV